MTYETIGRMFIYLVLPSSTLTFIWYTTSVVFSNREEIKKINDKLNLKEYETMEDTNE